MYSFKFGYMLILVDINYSWFNVSKTYKLVLQAVNDCVLLTLKPQITTEIIRFTLS